MLVSSLSGVASATIDATGRWRMLLIGGFEEIPVDVSQTGTALTVTFLPAPSPFTGTIDPDTGVFQVTGPPEGAGCPGTTVFSGTVAADGNSLTGDYATSVAQPIGPCLAVTLDTTGRRVAPECGDFFVDPGEECDDGNTASGDGCTATCQLEPCSGVPLSNCVVGTSALLDVRRGATSARNAATSRWANAVQDVSVASLGDPRVATSYALCVWDFSGPWPRRILMLEAPGGASCSRGPCWQSIRRGTGFAYRDRTAQSGIVEIVLQAGVAGQSKVQVRARGANVPVPSLPSTSTRFAVQLQGRNAACFTTPLDFGAVRQNTATHLLVKTR